MNAQVLDIVLPQLGRLGLKLVREGYIKGEANKTLLAIADGIEAAMDMMPADLLQGKNNFKID